MQVNSSSKLTVYHDGQFWVALCEHAEGKLYGARRIVFGSTEPNDEQLLEFVLEKWAALEFSLRPFEGRTQEPSHTNPKRQQRQARKALQNVGIGTKAQQAIKAQQEEGKQERVRATRDRRNEEQERRFVLKQQKRKAKHRGH